MLLSRHPLPPLFSTEETASAQPVAMPSRDLFSDLEQWEVSGKDEEEWNRVGASRFPHLHSLWLLGSQWLPEVQLLQRGLLFTFARLVQQAVQQFGPGCLGQALPSPLSGQCVLTNGQRVGFIWLQLNTLALGEAAPSGDGGGGNVVGVARPGLLYADTETLRGQSKRKVVGFREDILRTILATTLLH